MFPAKDCLIDPQIEMDLSVIDELRRAWQEWQQQQTATITIIPTVQYDEQGPFVDGTLEVLR